MPAGLQVWGPDGSLWVDTSSRLARGYGSASLNVNTSQAVPLTGQGTPYTIIPLMSKESTTLSNGTQFDCPVFYNYTISSTSLDASNNSLPTGADQSGSVFFYYGAF